MALDFRLDRRQGTAAGERSPQVATWLLLGPLGALAALAALACSPEGSSLALGDGGGGASSATSSTSSSGAEGGTGGFGAAGGQAGSDPEPPGPARLTVVNGTVDADEIRLCFMPFPSGGDAWPWPAEGALPYAAGSRIDEDASPIVEGSDVEILELTGELDPSYGLDCAAIRAGPPPETPGPWPVVSSLGVLPQSALDAERSLLLVTVGCVGGEAHTDMVEELACGPGYTPTTPTAALLAAPMSRIEVADRISMQFAQGSLAMPVSDVRVRAGDGAASPVLAVDGWNVGAVAPRPPFAHFSHTTIGAAADATIELLTVNTTTPAYSGTFGDAFAQSALLLDELGDGDRVVFVAVGAMPGLSAGAWWHELRFTVVEAAPP